MALQHPTPYPDVNALLHQVLVGAQQILGGHFVGMYLEGSLVSDDFDQDSDIDFVVVSDEEVSSDQFAALQLMHERIATLDSWYADQVEGFYISQHALRRCNPAHTLYANIERGPGERLKLGQLDWWWIVHLAILRERGVTLAGPAPQNLIEPITPRDLLRTMVESVPGWATPKLTHPEQLHTRGVQSYVVLTLCRMLYTLHTGRVVTKRVAADWAIATLESRWVPLIERAWVGRHNPDAEQTANGRWTPLNGRTWAGFLSVHVSPEEVNETMAFVRYTIERSQQLEMPAG